jgi:RNA polymerase sigma factor (sigma-70 family)
MAFDLMRSNSSADGPFWADLYRRHAPDLRRLIVRKVPPDAPIDDLLQEVFYQAYRSRDRVDLSQPMGGWLARIAQRVCITWWRRQKADGGPWDADERIDPTVFPGSDEHLTALDRGRRVSTALGRLSPRHRYLLVGHTQGELSCEHLARSEGSSPKAVKSALGRARTEFRRHIEDLPVAAVVCRRWYARHQRAVPVAEGLGAWVGAVVTLGVIATLSIAPVGLRQDARERLADDSTSVASAGSSAAVHPPQAEAERARGTERRTEHSTASRAASQPPTASPRSTGAGVSAAGVGSRADVTRTPEGTWVTVEVTRTLPVVGGEATVGTSIRCDQGLVTQVGCTALGAVPEPG